MGTGRRRKNRHVAVLVGAILFSGGAIFLSYLLLFEPERLLRVGGDRPIEEVVFETDGTLSHQWVLEKLELPEDITLIQADIFTLLEQVENHPQVQKCIIRKKHPSTLVVKIEERKPVLRLRLKGADGAPETLYVAEDGTIFPGLGLDPSLTRRMPFLTGVQPVEVNNAYVPIPGFPVVADLIETAKIGYPEIFRDWRIIDLSLFDPDPAASFSAIRVRSTNIKEVLFGVGDFGEELLKLKDVVDLTREQGVTKLKRVDLRFDESVPMLP